MDENDSRKLAHNTQTDKARVRTRAGRRRAVCRDRSSHKADALKPSLQPGPVACPHHGRLSSVLKILNWAIMASRLVGRFFCTAAERKDSLFSYLGCCSGPAALLSARLATLFCPRRFALARCFSCGFISFWRFELDAHGSPQKSRATPSSLRVVGLPARFARPAGGLAVILMRESAVAATTTGASATANTARGRSSLGLASLTLRLRPPNSFPSRPAMASAASWSLGISTKAKPRARPVSRSVRT